MNLHAIVFGAIGTVNPNQTVTIQQSAGYSTSDDGTRVPLYTVATVPAQVQDLTADDLRLIEGMNIQGLHKAVYLNGQFAGAVRADIKGGDIFTFDDHDWLVTQVAEGWTQAGWCKCIVTQQSPTGVVVPFTRKR